MLIVLVVPGSTTGCNYTYCGMWWRSLIIKTNLCFIYAFVEMAERQTSRFIVYDMSRPGLITPFLLRRQERLLTWTGPLYTICLLNSSKSHPLVQIRLACQLLKELKPLQCNYVDVVFLSYYRPMYRMPLITQPTPPGMASHQSCGRKKWEKRGPGRTMCLSLH